MHQIVKYLSIRHKLSSFSLQIDLFKIQLLIVILKTLIHC
jgi:hypothetical protein